MILLSAWIFDTDPITIALRRTYRNQVWLKAKPLKTIILLCFPVISLFILDKSSS